jgi:predicted DNA-binding transcriptional regulator YafY
MEITPWIRSWGADVEVIEPKELRDDFEKLTKRLHAMYKPKR